MDQVLAEMKRHAIPSEPEQDISLDEESFEIDNVGSASDHHSISTNSAFAFSQVERTDTHASSAEPQVHHLMLPMLFIDNNIVSRWHILG